MSKRFEGRVALVTGAARGIGRATAERFAGEGAVVALFDWDARVGAAASEIGRGAFALEVDVTDAAAVKAAVDKVVQRAGKIDVLVNNAGITRDATLLKTSDEAWAQVLAVNLTGTFNVGRAVAAHMVPRASGAIVNAASVVGVFGNFGQSNYVA